MNKSCKSKWNETTGTYVAASETANGRKKSASGPALAIGAVVIAVAAMGGRAESTCERCGDWW